LFPLTPPHYSEAAATYPPALREGRVERRVLILTSDTGGGHTSAARALEAGLTKVAEGVRFLVHTAHALEECSALTRAGGNLYNFLLRSHQKYVKYYHRRAVAYHQALRQTLPGTALCQALPESYRVSASDVPVPHCTHPARAEPAR
jgi:hypothetical protein